MNKTLIPVTTLSRWIGLSATLVFAASAMSAQIPTAGNKARSCAERKQVLLKFEAAAPKIRNLLIKAELILAEMQDYGSYETAMALIKKHEKDINEILSYDIDSDLPVMPAEGDPFLELFDPKTIEEQLRDIRNSTTYIMVKRKQLGLVIRRDYVANQIFLLRDIIASLGCGGAVDVKVGTSFDAAKFPFFKETKTWDLSLTDESISLPDGRSEKRIFHLKTVGSEYNNSIKGTLTNAIPLSYLFGPSWIGKANIPCDAVFDNDVLTIGCGEGTDRELFTGRFTVTLVDCVVPKLKGTIRYRGEYIRPARQWDLSGRLDWEPIPPSNCKSR